MGIDTQTLRIVLYPDPVLRRRAKPIEAVNDEVRAVALRMIELMTGAEGIGLAAPQVGLSWRLFVAHVPPGPERDPEADPPTASTEPRVFINPELSNPIGELQSYEEGCLSLPEITGDVFRPPTITMTATDLDGNRFTKTASGLLARCWQHEYDHLEGVLILDRMTQMSRLKNRAAIRLMEKAAG